MNIKKIIVASDHAGLELKTKIIQKFSDIEWLDLGPNTDESVDYPDYALPAIKKLISLSPEISDSTQPIENFALLICGTGQGMAITANKTQSIRAALCWNIDSARLAREHNNANILCLASRLVDEETNFKILNQFLSTEFAGDRHIRRVSKITGVNT